MDGTTEAAVPAPGRSHGGEVMRPAWWTPLAWMCVMVCVFLLGAILFLIQELFAHLHL